MPSYTFRLGDHALASKKGHCTACSAVQALVTVEADDLDQAVEEANRATGHQVGVWANRANIHVTFKATVTKRQLVKEEKR